METEQDAGVSEMDLPSDFPCPDVKGVGPASEGSRQLRKVKMLR